jgi:hypothetical protein
MLLFADYDQKHAGLHSACNEICLKNNWRYCVVGSQWSCPENVGNFTYREWNQLCCHAKLVILTDSYAYLAETLFHLNIPFVITGKAKSTQELLTYIKAESQQEYEPTGLNYIDLAKGLI